MAVNFKTSRQNNAKKISINEKLAIPRQNHKIFSQESLNSLNTIMPKIAYLNTMIPMARATNFLAKINFPANQKRTKSNRINPEPSTKEMAWCGVDSHIKPIPNNRVVRD
jgi:uncharacterized protein YcbK (DUF882 family)